MLTGVEILLERMKTNPEEFIEGEMSKWSRVMSSGWDIFTEEERTALQDAIISAKRDHFSGEVMRVLAQGHDDQLVRTDDYLVKGKIPMQGVRPSATISNSTLTSATLTQQIKDTLDKQFDEAYARRDKKTMQTASKLKGMMRK